MTGIGEGTRTRIPPEDPEAVMRRDRVPRRGGRHAKHRQTSFWPLVRARLAAYDIPGCVAAVLANPDTYGHRFTPLQARVLVLKYSGGETHRNGDVADALGTTTAAVYSALRAAEAEARVLIDEWSPILAKLAAGATRASLSPEELRVHERCRKAKRGLLKPDSLPPMSGAPTTNVGRGRVEVRGRPVKPWDETERPGGHTKQGLRRAWNHDADNDAEAEAARRREDAADAVRNALRQWSREAGTSAGEDG
jgi:hypothetical protein